MSSSAIAFWIGTAGLVVGQRYAMPDSWRMVVMAVSLAIAYGVAAGFRQALLRRAQNDGVRYGHRVATLGWVVTLVAVGLYGLTTDELGVLWGWAGDARARWITVIGWLWPLVWLLGAIPMMTVDWGLTHSPMMIPIRRVRLLAGHGMLVSLSLGVVAPLNYVGWKHNPTWDLAYFKAPTPGTATKALVEALDVPVDVRIFMPGSSEVTQELRHYFAPLEGPMLRVHVLDQAAVPELARTLRIRGNGTIAITAGRVPVARTDMSTPDHADAEPMPVTRTLQVSEQLEQAKRTLKQLDREVQQRLIEIGQGERIAYMTTGHGELAALDRQRAPEHQVKIFHDFLRQLGFTVRPLGVQQGLGEAVPDDADVVVVLGPRGGFKMAECDALRAYLHRGGALLIALEPAELRNRGPRVVVDDPLITFVADELGVQLAPGVLAAETGTMPISRGPQDRTQIVTNTFLPHPSIRMTAKLAPQIVLFTPSAGHLEARPEPPADVTFTVDSWPTTWADLPPLNLEFEPDRGETLAARHLVAAISGAETSTAWRALVTADASMFTDFAITQFGNRGLVEEGMNWLIGAEALSGTTEHEEDVRIVHTATGQAVWFYLTVLAVPGLMLGMGAFRLRRRRKDHVVPVRGGR